MAAVRWAAAGVVALLALGGCAQGHPAADADSVEPPAPTAAVHRRSATLQTHPKQPPPEPGHRVPSPSRLVQIGAWDAASTPAAGHLAVHVDYACSPHPDDDGGTCAVSVTNLEASTLPLAWQFSGPRSTNITSVSLPGGLLRPGERSGELVVALAGCPARFALVDPGSALATQHDLCLE